MSDKSKIEWTEATWNPVTGCTKVSAGCKHCYAERDWARLAANPGTSYYGREFTDVRCHPDRLDQPLRWTKPRRIFVNSMSDLFHEAVPDEFIDRVWGVMSLAPRHVFQILTKRPERMAEIMPKLAARHRPPDGSRWPLPNVWLGVTAENQEATDERIPLLLQTPAAVRFVSMEPLLGPVAICEHVHENGIGRVSMDGIDWVIVGGESGPKARPMHPEWVRSLRDQCQAAGVPFFFKQWGEFASVYDRDKDDPDWRRCADIERRNKNGRWLNLAGGHGFHGERVHYVKKVGKKAAGRELDGRTWEDMPACHP